MCCDFSNFDKNTLACTLMRTEVRNNNIDNCKRKVHSVDRHDTLQHATEHATTADHDHDHDDDDVDVFSCSFARAIITCEVAMESTDRGGSRAPAPSEPESAGACAGIFPRVLGVERVAR